MYTKKILSAAAAVAVMTSGAMAFDTYNNNLATDSGGKITYASYTTGVPMTTAFTLSTTQKGDALIYPAFTQDDGFGTEIVVRNTSDKAIVAKAVLYAGEDSEELLDFNIYLSGKDVCRFTIKDGVISSSDGSIRTSGIYPNDVNVYDTTTARDKTDYTDIKFADELAFSYPFAADKATKGYVAIFGMVQADSITSGVSDIKGGFHNNHDDLYAAYAKLLNDTRGTAWRDIKNSSVILGSMFINNVTTAPNIALPGTATTWNLSSSKTATTTFTQVDDVLTGHVRLENSNGYDMLLPATAISGFSIDNSGPDNVVLWTEGEYAAIADRCIVATGDSYDTTCLTNDAANFMVNSAVYTYANAEGETDNSVVITQPYKRIMLQLGQTTGYSFVSTKTTKTVETGAKSYFTTTADVYDEDENKAETQYTTGIILSGLEGSTPSVDKYTSEVEAIGPEAFEMSDVAKEDFGAGNGFADFTVGVPAIITQMVATKPGSTAELNWVYSDTK